MNRRSGKVAGKKAGSEQEGFKGIKQFFRWFKRIGRQRSGGRDTGKYGELVLVLGNHGDRLPAVVTYERGGSASCRRHTEVFCRWEGINRQLIDRQVENQARSTGEERNAGRWEGRCAGRQACR